MMNPFTRVCVYFDPEVGVCSDYEAATHLHDLDDPESPWHSKTMAEMFPEQHGFAPAWTVWLLDGSGWLHRLAQRLVLWAADKRNALSAPR